MHYRQLAEALPPKLIKLERISFKQRGVALQRCNELLWMSCACVAVVASTKTKEDQPHLTTEWPMPIPGHGPEIHSLASGLSF